jgi:DNA (cytosine-5)-methyltransferase 1
MTPPPREIKPLRCVDLFAGCGGLSLGFERAGLHVVGAFDHWDAAIAIYQHNFSHPIYKQDLTDEFTTLEKIQTLSPDLIMGGPPCQDFSSAGKRDVTQGRADLTYHFANMVCAAQPTWFVMENVEQIKKSHILTDVIEQFKTYGYGLTAVILDAAYCSVPQSRTRFFLIGYLGGQHNGLAALFEKNLNQKPMTVRDYFQDSLDTEFYYRHPRNYNRRAIFGLDEPSPTIRGVNRPIPKTYIPNSCDPQGIDLAQVRPLTTLERSYLQTFPRDFKFFGTKTDLEQMIGNAVPVHLSSFIARGILEYLENPTIYQNKQLPTDDVIIYKLPQKSTTNRKDIPDKTNNMQPVLAFF